LELFVGEISSGLGGSWWNLGATSSSINSTNTNSPSPPIFFWSGRVPSASALNLGLVGVYATVVLAVGRFLRLSVMGSSQNIIYTDLQDATLILSMCRDVYIARLHRQLVLEEQLYVELINLLRSPETLMTRTGDYIHYWPLPPDHRENETDSDIYDAGDEDAFDHHSKKKSVNLKRNAENIVKHLKSSSTSIPPDPYSSFPIKES
jgi:hypothetical protein